MVTRCARKEQSLLFNMFEAFELIEISDKSDFFSPIKTYFAHYVELPTNISENNFLKISFLLNFLFCNENSFLNEYYNIYTFL